MVVFLQAIGLDHRAELMSLTIGADFLFTPWTDFLGLCIRRNNSRWKIYLKQVEIQTWPTEWLGGAKPLNWQNSKNKVSQKCNNTSPEFIMPSEIQGYILENIFFVPLKKNGVNFVDIGEIFLRQF